MNRHPLHTSGLAVDFNEHELHYLYNSQRLFQCTFHVIGPIAATGLWSIGLSPEKLPSTLKAKQWRRTTVRTRRLGESQTSILSLQHINSVLGQVDDSSMPAIAPDAFKGIDSHQDRTKAAEATAPADRVASELEAT